MSGGIGQFVIGQGGIGVQPSIGGGQSGGTGVVMQAASTGAAPKPPNHMQTITVVGGNLFAIAAQQYGDATAWLQIARANGLSDPFLSGLSVLIIPPYDPTQAGGVQVFQAAPQSTIASKPKPVTPTSTVVVGGGSGGSSASNTVADLTAIIDTLPTTLPSAPGQLWINGGVLQVS